MMDRGEFVKRTIEINPTANGGYVVSRAARLYEPNSLSESLAFSNYKDLLRWMIDEYPAAHGRAEPVPGELIDPTKYV